MQETYGLVPTEQRLPAQFPRRAREIPESPVELGSESILVRRCLAEIRIAEGYVNAAAGLLEEATGLGPYDATSHLALARVYLLINQRKNAIAILEFEPSNEAARRAPEEARQRP